MSKSERRMAHAQDEDERRKAEALATPRHAHDQSWGYPGVGHLHVQLVRCPSHAPCVCYEIRGDLGALALYRSMSKSPDEDRVLGHERISVKPAELYRVVRALEMVRVPVRLPYLPVGVLDGIWYEVNVFGGVQTMARFRWSGDEPGEGWQPLVSLALSSINRFDAACFDPDVEDNTGASSESLPLGATGKPETAKPVVVGDTTASDFEVTRKWRGPGAGVVLRIEHRPTGIAVERYIGHENESPFLIALMAGLHVLINPRSDSDTRTTSAAAPTGDLE